MTTAISTTQEQISISADVSYVAEVDAGDRVEFVAANRSITAIKGMFGKLGKSVSIDDMNKPLPSAEPVHDDPLPHRCASASRTRLKITSLSAEMFNAYFLLCTKLFDMNKFSVFRIWSRYFWHEHNYSKHLQLSGM